MMQSAESREGDDSAHIGMLDGPSAWRVAVQRHVRPVLIVEFRVRANASQEVTFAEHDQVVGELTSKLPDEPFDVSVLPRRSRRDAEVANAKVVDAPIEC